MPRRILGIDEVGRGPWAGPLVVGAVILPNFNSTASTSVLQEEPGASRTHNPSQEEPGASAPPDWYAALTDSKKLTAKKRAGLATEIQKHALAYGLGWVSAHELDELGLAAALKLATRRAVLQVRSAKVPFTEIIIDGTVNFLSGTTLENYVTILKKADLLIKEVSAASIIAKVARDEYMITLAEKYPDYGFEKHVGYGTALHKAALEKYGPTPEHRTSFRPVRAKSQSVKAARGLLAYQNGHQAEAIVADYLEQAGHTILARNYKTKFYEIDIVSVKDSKIYFTEVKYRIGRTHGAPLENVTTKKREQMRFAAESFLKFFQLPYQPLLAVASVSGKDFNVDKFFALDE